MTRTTTITLSFLLVLLVIAGMCIKTKKLEPCLADSLAAKPELISRLPYYAKAIGVVSVSGHKGNEIDTIPDYFPNHSEIPTR